MTTAFDLLPEHTKEKREKVRQAFLEKKIHCDRHTIEVFLQTIKKANLEKIKRNYWAKKYKEFIKMHIPNYVQS